MKFFSCKLKIGQSFTSASYPANVLGGSCSTLFKSNDLNLMPISSWSGSTPGGGGGGSRIPVNNVGGGGRISGARIGK